MTPHKRAPIWEIEAHWKPVPPRPVPVGQTREGTRQKDTEMLKKMMLLACMATAALAVSASAAQAEGLLKEGGVALEEGAHVTATSFDLKTTATDLPGSPDLECGKVTIHGTVTFNGTEEATIEENSVTTENCNAVIT